jgi:hypothetical protein
MAVSAPSKENAIRQIDFKNFAYPWNEPGGVPSTWHWMSTSPVESVRMVSGTYRFHVPNWSESDPSRDEGIRLTSITYGDVDGDRNEEAAVAVNYSTGGTANWDYLYVYKLQHKTPKLLARLESGPRADGGLVRVSIENGTLVLDFADTERRVADCCSEGFIRVRYRWQQEHFVETGPREHGSLKLEGRWGPAQHAKPKEQKEQSEFGIELEAMPIQRPVSLPREALNALSNDERVASCLENEGLSSKELPANWFIASEIHLDGQNETDLVVLPDDRPPYTTAGKISSVACFLGANTAQMWVLRKTQPGFKLVLSQIGLGMTVLATKTNGHRDIQVGAAVGGYVDSIDFKFDGESYKIADRTSNLFGAELPHSLSAFRTREMLVQLPEQSSDAVRAKARAWLWQQWEEHRPSYLTLKTHDETADDTTSYFIAPGENGKWQVTIQVRRIVRDDNATASQHRITEKKLLVATDVQRIELTTEGTHALPRVISEDEILPESKYRLKFLDYAGRTAATL